MKELWYEVCLTPMPAAEFKACLEIQAQPLRPHDPRSPKVEKQVMIHRLVTPAVWDVVAGVPVGAFSGPQGIRIGPVFDIPA
ncbi:MAG TPA: hypothetical protein VNC39_13440 [Acidocella sp.]|uniref:hypothetical protein n=1 Tax=Acidocella sp. TaxID=50710 RepID=UPI002C4305EB|nr:hypothetical protein [Acidocella sp.]HVE22972.1 hypothetical protein [Acidocella sp.]